MAEVRIAHRYPEALAFLRAHGADAVVVLHDLLAHAEIRDGRIVASASCRRIAEDLEFLSKDSVHRRLRQLHRARVIRPLGSPDAFATPTYLVDLSGTGISVGPA